MRVAQSYQEASFKKYSLGLLMTAERKVCTNMGKSLGIKHDSVYRSISKNDRIKEIIIDSLEKLAEYMFEDKLVYLVFDETVISKRYAEQIEGIDVGYDGSIKDTVLGLPMVTVLLTDGNVKIPINTIPYISKKLIGKDYKSKSEIAIEIIKLLQGKIKFDMILADAHYATNIMLQFLKAQGIKFLMRFSNNRVVQIADVKGQIKKHPFAKLKKNDKGSHSYGLIGKHAYHFYV